MVSWPPVKRLAASSATSCTSGVDPSGNVARGHLREDVVAGRTPAVLDVRRELLVEELERLVLGSSPILLNPSANEAWSSSGTPSSSATTSRANGFA